MCRVLCVRTLEPCRETRSVTMLVAAERRVIRTSPAEVGWVVGGAPPSPSPPPPPPPCDDIRRRPGAHHELALLCICIHVASQIRVTALDVRSGACISEPPRTGTVPTSEASQPTSYSTASADRTGRASLSPVAGSNQQPCWGRTGCGWRADLQRLRGTDIHLGYKSKRTLTTVVCPATVHDRQAGAAEPTVWPPPPAPASASHQAGHHTILPPSSPRSLPRTPSRLPPRNSPLAQAPPPVARPSVHPRPPAQARRRLSRRRPRREARPAPTEPPETAQGCERPPY